MECSKCGKDMDKGTTITYYWTPVLNRYAQGNHIVSKYNKANAKETPITICDRCLNRRLRTAAVFYVFCAALFFIAGAAWTVFALLALDLADTDWLIGLILMDVLLFGTAVMCVIFAARQKSNKTVNRTVARMAQSAAYRSIYIPNGGARGVVMWRR